MVVEYKAPVDEALFLLESVIKTGIEPELARAVLEEAGRFVSGVLAPLNPVGDEQGSVLKDGVVKTPDGFPEAYQQFVEGGWPGLDLPEQYGGQDLPLPLQVAVSEMVNGANVALGMLPTAVRAAAWLLIEHADHELADIIVPHLVRGDWGATICISEAQAGSDVGRIRTMATQDKEAYRVTGEKMFISYGDHDMTDQIVHMALARTEDAAPGTRGLSLFAIPKLDLDSGEQNAVFVSRVEKKMGLKASPTCVLDLDGARAYRIGPEGRGLHCMFAMVKLMRLEVAIQGVGIAHAASEAAWHYASERPQGGPANATPVMIAEHPDVQRMLFDMRCRTQAIRALVMETAQMLNVAGHTESETERAEIAMMTDLLLPVCKTCGAENAFRSANTAIQVLGGHGYISETGIEQYARDSRVMTIYEGTSGIQALDLVFRKIVRTDGECSRVLLQRMRNDVDVSKARLNPDLIKQVDDALAAFESITHHIISMASQSSEEVEAVATDYLHLTGLITGAWMWVRMAAAADSGSKRDDMRLRLASFYIDYVLPESQLHITRIKTGRGALRGYQHD